MPRSPHLIGLLLFGFATLACSTTESDGADNMAYSIPQDESFPAFENWGDIMENVIGPSFDEILIVEATKDPEDMDLPKIAAASKRAARYMALGHGVHQDKSIKTFGTIAKDCEAWFLDIEAKARAGKAKPVQGLIMKGERQYCDRCHEAD